MEHTDTQQPTVHQLIIFSPIALLQLVLNYCSSHCESWYARQHPADGKTKRIHTHIMLKNPTVSKNSYIKELNKLGFHGSEAFSYLTVTQEERLPYKEEFLGPYISKGKQKDEKYPQLYHNYTEEDILTYIELYKERRKARDEEKVTIDDVEVNRTEKYFLDILKKTKDHFKNTQMFELYTVRKFVIKLMTSKTGLLPNPAQYKRFAASIYVVMKKDTNNAEITALDEVLEWHY